MNRKNFLKTISLTTIGSSFIGCKSLKRKNRPNVLFIMADDLGYNHLGCYGQEKIKTPNIDKLATQGVKFLQAYAGCTVCGPSRSALMTGLHTGHVPYRNNKGIVPIISKNKTIAEIFKEAGYTTGCFGKWGLGGPCSKQIPTKRGFDQFWGILNQGHGHIHYPSYIWHNEEKFYIGNKVLKSNRNDWGKTSPNPKDRKKHTDTVFEEKALQFVQQNHKKPFFCYLSFTVPHTEMIARESATKDYRKKHWPEYYSGNNGTHLPTKTPRANFAGMVTQVDQTVGKITALLNKLNIADNTIVIFTSDNGGQLKQTWGNAPSIFFKANGILRMGKTWNYEGGIRVPMIIRWTKKLKPNTTCNHPCYFPDFMPTFAQLVGIKPPENIDGLSMLPTLLGKPKQQKEHKFMYWEEPHYIGKLPKTRLRQAVRMGKWKGIREDTTDKNIELYNLETDISEKHNLVKQYPKIAAKIVAIMNREHTPPLPQ